jgi:hypothetical protein
MKCYKVIPSHSLGLPGPRWGHSCSVLNDNEIFIFGGSGTKIYGDSYIYSIGIITGILQYLVLKSLPKDWII